ncbi:MAG: site-specific integrase [Rhodospirillales bacterium]|nr:site-specific integrase [Rhodospirillales bacterium]
MAIRKRTWTTPAGEARTAWQADYQDQHGRRHRKAFETKRAAEEWMTRAKHEVQQGVHTPESRSITFAQAAAAWHARGKVEGLERSTLEQYQDHLDHHLLPLLGPVKLAKLTTPGIEEVRDQLLATRSRVMARKLLTTLKMILSDAQRRGSVAQNVAAPVRVKTGRRAKRKVCAGVDFPTTAQVKAILDHASERWCPLLTTAVFTGMRVSELLGLRWQDVDFDRRIIHVRQRKDRYGRFGSPKSEAGQRQIPMTPTVLNVLSAWQSTCPVGVDGLVFPAGTGKPEQHSNVHHRALGAAQRAAGIVDEAGKPRYGMHALRHWFASWAIAPREQGGLGFTPKRAQEVLGHSGIELTMNTYAHLLPTEASDEAVFAAAEAAVLAQVWHTPIQVPTSAASKTLTSKQSARSSAG